MWSPPSVLAVDFVRDCPSNVRVTSFPVWVRRGFRVAALEDREYQLDRLAFVKNQLNLLIEDVKKRIKAISEDVEAKVLSTPGRDLLSAALGADM